MENKPMKFYSKASNKAPIHAIPGHFATSNSHVNYYIDLTSLKTRVKEAEEVAKLMAAKYVNCNRYIDTIVCLDGTEVVGAFLAQEFERRDFMSTNIHETIYIITPEFNEQGQLFFRDNTQAAIKKKNVLLLSATTTTGNTLSRSIDCIKYYQGIITGISSLFSVVDSIEGYDVETVFTDKDLPGYTAYSYRDCPFCKKGIKVEALVNGFGYSEF
ncbi:MAG: orotate phosphoribosyltransferase [Lachnospiraceae bacterium]